MIALFLLLSVLLLVSAVGVIVFRNPIHCALCLVGNLLLVAVCFAMLEAHFLAAVQVIVYAGAIMVLVLFMLMLLNIKGERRTRWESIVTVVGLLTGMVFLWQIVPYLLESFKVFPVGSARAIGTVKAMGRMLFSDYILLFQASGVLLMAAIVGAVMIARVKQR